MRIHGPEIRADRPLDWAAGVCWITGASSGIGRALARRMARAGWRVVASARSEDALRTLAADAPEGNIVPMVLDTTDTDAVREAVRRIEDEVGPIAIAVLNAGTHSPVAVNGLSLEPFRTLAAVNLIGTIGCLVPVVEAMRRRGRGRIAVVASVAGYRGLPTASAYGMTKAGLINMTEALAPELAVAGVRLQLVNPGFVRTPLTDRNEFQMPFLMDVDNAAEAIYRGLSSTRFEIAFPRIFVWMMKLYRALPYALAFAVARAIMPRRKSGISGG